MGSDYWPAVIMQATGHTAYPSLNNPKYFLYDKPFQTKLEANIPNNGLTTNNL